MVDHRGETIYSTETGEPIVVTTLGNYPAGTTTLAPVTPYDKWDGSVWVTDTASQQTAEGEDAQAEKQWRIDEANIWINAQQWPSKLALGRLSEDETVKFNGWLDYLDAVNAIDTSTAPDIKWPTLPE
ncbi:tail fiber assembly protein [Apirhabdus apintestini]|nr:tail fiber assembly protein [Enterobacteriaceae bacterium CA-0114]